MTQCGLDVFMESIPEGVRGKRIGVLCHAASITSEFRHIVDVFAASPELDLAAIFGPQHGLYGQTQDNMIEWEGMTHPRLNIPVYSLYGRVRKPTAEMLDGLDVLVVDLQDVGARPYTYIWTVKLCMESCAEAGIPVWILDRPNPVAAVAVDGPMLGADHFSFVGGLDIPLCHRLTLGEMALLIKERHVPDVQLSVVRMSGWWRNSLWPETGLPWVLPSPNMPTFDTALVYPGMVVFEATNLSEGRGTTRPFELFGAPYLDTVAFEKVYGLVEVPGCRLREHGFIPTFGKWGGDSCTGWQIHVTDPRAFRPVYTAVTILWATHEVASEAFAFKPPPYEYEMEKMPLDILSGSPRLREALQQGVRPEVLAEEWEDGLNRFKSELQSVGLYPEERG